MWAAPRAPDPGFAWVSTQGYLISAGHLILCDWPRDNIQREAAFPFSLALPSIQHPFPGPDVSSWCPPSLLP